MSILDLEWLGKRRVNAYARIVFIAVVLSAYKPFTDALGTVGSDFYAFWGAGKLALGGEAAKAYDPFAIGKVQAAAGWDKIMAFVNPPAMFTFVAPLGWLSFPAAWIAWVVATFGFWFSMTRQLAPKLTWPTLSFPGAAIAGWHAQTGLLTGGFLAGAALFLKSRPFVAGLFFGALIVKPHLAILVPIALLAARQWSAIAGAAVSAIGLTLLAWVLFGTEAILAYQTSWRVSELLMLKADTDFLLRFSTIYAGARIFLGEQLAMVLQAAVTLTLAVLTWQAWTKPGDLGGKVAFLLTAGALATPYLFNYDLAFLIVPVLWLASRAMARGWRRGEKLVLAFHYLAPLLSRAMALPMGFNFMPLALFWLLWLVWRELHEADETAQSALAPAR